MVLLEELVNRYRNPWVAPIRFPSVILPVLMIIGAFLAFVFMPFVILMFVLEVLPEVFTPKLTLVSALVGSGLVLAPLATGAIYGQVLEKRTGYVRSGYEAKIMLYLFILGMSLPFPAYYGFKFFYNYPFARYPSYILEVKPSPELKEEIERFGLAEIKWHTPYDYSLERQVIRYDFGEPVDGDWTSQYSKVEIFREVLTQINRRVVDRIGLDNRSNLYIKGAGYPYVVELDSGELICVLGMGGVDGARTPYIEYLNDNTIKRIPLVAQKENEIDAVLLDMSSAFESYKKETALGFEDEEYSCAMRAHHGQNYLFFVSKVFFPTLYQNIFSYEKNMRLEVNFGIERIVGSIRSL